MMAQLKSVPACEGDEQMVARVHLRAMQHNELIHAQFPSEKALDFLRQWLEKDTLDHIHSDEKGVLVTWDNESKDMASFVKWIVHRKVSDEQPDDDQQWPSFCRSEYLDSYADLTANIRQEVMGTEPYYRESALFVLHRRPDLANTSSTCTQPPYNAPKTDIDRRHVSLH
jgi:hypothetical protein